MLTCFIIQTIFVTGGFSSLPGFSNRIFTSLRSILPVGASFQVKRAENPLLDAWRGAAMIAKQSGYKRYAVTRKEYEEYGGEYIKEHGLGNIFR